MNPNSSNAPTTAESETPAVTLAGVRNWKSTAGPAGGMNWPNAIGLLPTGDWPRTLKSNVSIATTSLNPVSATSSRLPSGVSARPPGNAPESRLIVSMTVLLAISITDTESSLEFDTYTKQSHGSIATA